MAIAEHKFYFLVPEEKPHWSESLPPWLLLSALLIALGYFFLVHVQKPKMVSLRSQTTVHKTFEIPNLSGPRRPAQPCRGSCPPAGR
ncbi:TonB family protein [Acidithiobacillus sp. GGI-221]|nr:TonB family protein [Acidithiobacillus sp. GGI-221]